MFVPPQPLPPGLPPSSAPSLFHTVSLPEIWGTSDPDFLAAGTSHVGLIGVTIHGGDGADDIIGGSWNDTLFGDSGDDQISGGAGNDVIVGGLGADTMDGGAGADKFVWNNISEMMPNQNHEGDTVTDFNPLEGDTIDFTGVAHSLGLDHLTWVGDTSTANFHFNKVGEVGFYQDPLSPQDNYIKIYTGHDALNGDAGIHVINTVSTSPDASWFHL